MMIFNLTSLVRTYDFSMSHGFTKSTDVTRIGTLGVAPFGVYGVVFYLMVEGHRYIDVWSHKNWYIILAICVCLVAAFWGWNYVVRIRRNLVDTPISKIGTSPQGVVYITGKAKTHLRTVTDSRSQIECVWYRRRYMEYKNKGWQTVKTEESHDMIELEDDTGRCIVDLHGAYLTGMPKPKEYRQDYGRKIVVDYIFENEELHVLAYLQTVNVIEKFGGKAKLFFNAWQSRTRGQYPEYDLNGDQSLSVDEIAAARQAIAGQQGPAIYLPPVTPEGEITILDSPDPDTRKYFIVSPKPFSALQWPLVLLAWVHAVSFVSFCAVLAFMFLYS
jgi:hypothetical protein